MDLHDLLGDAGDAPVAELSRRAIVAFDAVAQGHRFVGGGHTAEHGGGVEVLSQQGGVGALPAALAVGHVDEVRDQHVVMGVGVAGPRSGVAGDGVDESTGSGGHCGVAPPAALLDDQPVQVGQRGVTLSIQDAVHVLGPSDHPQLGHRLVGGDDQFHAGTAGAHQALTGGRVHGAPGAVEGVELLRGHGAGQAEGGHPRAAPHQRRLAPGGVVGQGLAGVVVELAPIIAMNAIGHPTRRLRLQSSTEACCLCCPTTGVIAGGPRQIRVLSRQEGLRTSSSECRGIDVPRRKATGV
ncbi:MAG: hypothetical protein M3066_05510 [Actinomycetota bacterium]|nr:hypothetical protein [Actinomycetota bacterium]